MFKKLYHKTFRLQKPPHWLKVVKKGPPLEGL